MNKINKNKDLNNNSESYTDAEYVEISDNEDNKK